MVAIVSLFWHICTFRSGPNVIPLNTALTGLVILVNGLLNIGVLMALGEPDIDLVQAGTIAVVSMASTAGLVWFVMLLMNRGQRFAQSITALFGTDVILTLLLALVIGVSSTIHESAALFALTLLRLWSLAVYGFIFQRALEIHIGFGITMALFVVVFTVAITQTAISP